MNNFPKTLISIVGPTGIGKTKLSIALAQYFDTEIISSDSRQFYKEMPIGTAAPTPMELKAVPHHFVHHLSVVDSYNVGQFEKDALARLESLFHTKDIIIMVGGSGLYVEAVTKGLDHFPEIDPQVRETLNEQLQNNGLHFLQNRLMELDPVTYQTIALDNPHRVIRALEVTLGSGQPYSSFLNKNDAQRPFRTITVALTAERSILYERINQRVDQMLDQGLLKEVEELLPYRHYNALQTVGYSEIFKFLDQEWSWEFAISEIKKNSRRYAKRQLTWWRKKPHLLWFDYRCPAEQVAASVIEEIRRSPTSLLG